MSKGRGTVWKRPENGRWSFRVDLPPVNGKRREVRKHGFTTRREAAAALDEVIRRRDGRVIENAKITVGQFLTGWITEQRLDLKPTTWFGYERYVRLDIVPALGDVPLQGLHYDHVRGFVDDLIAAGRGTTTIRRIFSVLASALAAAVEQRRILHDPSDGVKLPQVEKAEMTVWSTDEALAFMEDTADDRLGPLFELMLATGLRRGEALALTWDDVDIDGRRLVVRRTLSEVGGKLVFSKPKTESSAAAVALMGRAVAALEVQALRQQLERDELGADYADQRLVFAREDGAPIRPETVSKRFPVLCKAAGVPRIRVHDLRHTAATLMIRSGVPLVVVSKILRHKTYSFTADTYGHLTEEIATEAAATYGAMLDAAKAERASVRAARERAHVEAAEGGAPRLRPVDHENDEGGSPSPGNRLVSDGAPEGIRTPNLLIRSQMLYPLSYGRVLCSCTCSTLPEATEIARAGSAEAPGFEPGMGGYPKPH